VSVTSLLKSPPKEDILGAQVLRKFSILAFFEKQLLTIEASRAKAI